MKLLLTFLVVLLGISFIESRTLWHQLEEYNFEHYIKEFGKKYLGEEYHQRKAIFDANIKEIRAHNKDGSKSWKRGVNQFTDLQNEELKGLLGVKKDILHSRSFKSKYRTEYMTPSVKDLPTNVDWREKGIISAIKDQGQCGSCWSFATAETIESHYALATGFLTDLSEQQILDCTPNPNDCGGTGGCQGGIAEIAYDQIIKQGGLASEWTYPYVSYSGQNFNCRNSSVQYVAKISSYVVLPSNQYDPLMSAIALKGPLTLSVDASTWFSYESGVFDGCNGETLDIDHAVQLVGYGTDPNKGDYWLVRNSWSPMWGEDGYIRLKRSSKVECKVDKTPQDGTGCNGGPSQVTVCGICGILYDVTYPII